MSDSLDNIHATYHHFSNYMKRWYYKKYNGFSINTMKQTKRIYKEFDSDKMLGYEAMQRVEQYKEKYGGIEIVYVDDDTFMGSMLVLIPSKGMGINTIFIPQCKMPSNTFFLYPEHMKQLISTIGKMKKEYKLI